MKFFRYVSFLLALVVTAVAGAPAHAQSVARTEDFLGTWGVNTSLYGAGPASYSNATGVVADTTYIGVRKVRWDMSPGTSPNSTQLSVLTGLANAGLRFITLPPYIFQGNQTLVISDLIAQNKLLNGLGPGNRVALIEGENEPSNFAYTYNGVSCGGSVGAQWTACGNFQKDYYAAVKADTTLQNIQVTGPTNIYAESPNVGLQFNTIPSGAGTTFAAGTVFADALAVHVYPEFLNPAMAQDIVPGVGDAGSNYTFGDHVNTSTNQYSGYASVATAWQQPKVVTEFNWQAGLNAGGNLPLSADIRGKNVLSGMLTFYTQGWTTAVVHELYNEGSDGYGVFDSTGTPTLLATYMHNLSVIMNDAGTTKSTFTPTPLTVGVSGLPSTALTRTFQKIGNGHYQVVLWNNVNNWNATTHAAITIAPTTVGLSFPSSGTIQTFDPIVGTSAQTTVTAAAAVSVALTDHPLVVDFIAATSSASPNGTVITPGAGTLNDGTHTYSINVNLGQIVEDGAIISGSNNTLQGEWCNSLVYFQDASNWYTWNQTVFTVTTAPTCTSSPGTGGTGKTSPPMPLTGTVTPQTWVAYDKTYSGITLTSGKAFHFNVLPPAQRDDTKYKYPLFIWLHPDGSGNNWYTGGNTDPFFYIPNEPANFNTVSFLTNWPGYVLVPYADQTCSAGSAVCNWGGWSNNGTTGSGTNFSGDTGPNTFALLATISYLETVYSIDPARIYCEGFSLGGIGCEYLLQKYNAYNGASKVFAAGASTGGVLEINGFGAGPTSANATTMSNVPVWWFSGANDGTSVPADWNLPMWRLLAGNSSYPSAITSATTNRAGSSQMHFTLCPTCGHQSTDSAGNPVSTNATINNWMFGISAPTGTGHFQVSAGQILDPSGKKFFPIGVNIGDFRAGVDLANAITNFTTGAPLTTLFPGINFVRVALYGGGSAASPTAYPAVTAYDSFVNTLTSLGIVVELEHHIGTTGSSAGGGQGIVPTLTDPWLIAESNNYAALAAHFQNNPYVWFGTNNEPPALTGLSQWQQATYNAIRNAGNLNPIMLEVWGSRPPGYGGTTMQAGMVQSIYSAMTNVLWDPHQYGFIDNYSTDQPTNNNTSRDIIAASQLITSADGKVPVIIGEYGPSTTGSTLDANGTQNVTAVLQSGVGSAVWHWGQQDCCNNTNNGSTLTALGTQVAAAIAAAATVTPPSETLSINSLSTVAANTSFTVSGSIINATSTPVLQYQNNNGGWVALPSGATVSQVAFSFIDPGLATAGTSNNTVSVRDANNTSVSAISNGFNVSGSQSANNTVVTATLPTPTFADNFTSLSLHGTWQAGDKWQLIAPDTTQGRGGANFQESGDQWWTNPFNASTPVSGIYVQDTSGLHLGLLATPSAYQSYINTTSGSTLPYVAGLLNTSKTNYQKYGYWETTVAVPAVPGFTFQADAENVQITGTWPPEIDLRISTAANGVQTVLFQFALGGGVYTQYTTSSTAGFNATLSHTYAWDWEAANITFYIDGVQVAQFANPSSAYTTNPMFLFLLTGANYIGTGDPAAAALPVSANVTSVNVYAAKPAVTSTGSIVDSGGAVWTISAGGKVALNGAADTTTGNVTELAYVNQVVWYLNQAGRWFYKTSAASPTWLPNGGTTTSPLTITASPSGTTVTSVGPVITDSTGSTFGISAGGKVVINGVDDAVTSGVVELAYVNGVVWQLNSLGNWYNYLGTPGSYGGPTTTSPLPNGTMTINTIAAQTAGIPFTVSGTELGVTSVPTLQYQDNAGSWLAFPGGSSITLASPTVFSDTLNPIDVTESGGAPIPGVQTVLAGTGGSFTDGSGGNWSISSGGQVFLNGALPNGQFSANVAEIDLVNGVVWQVNQSNQWYSWTGTAWANGTNPLAGGVSGSWMNHYPFGGSEYTLSANNEAECYVSATRTPGFNPFRITGGFFTIVADSVAHTVTNPCGLPYNSGAITSATEPNGSPGVGLYNRQYGYFAAKMLLPPGRGLWPAFWLMPQDGGAGEIDIMEALGDDLTHVYTTIHYPGNTNADSAQVAVSDYSQNWHEYAVDWESDFLTWYIDGVQVFQRPTPDTLKKPFYLLSNLAVGATGSWPGPPDGSTVFPAPMQVQYIKVYASKPVGAGTTAIWSFTNPALPANATNTVSVRDAANISIVASSNGFAVSSNEVLGLNAVSSQTANAPFTVTGTLLNLTSAPTLQYQNNGGAWVALPAGATVTSTQFSFNNPGLPANSAATVSVRDANNTAAQATATFAVLTVGAIGTTWNPADSSASITLSNSNTTALSSSAVQGGTRSITGHTTGKYCFDVVANTLTANTAIGISNANFALVGPSALGADVNGVGFYTALTGSLQSVLFNGVQILAPTLLTDVSGDTITVCDDLTAQLEWVSDPVMRAAQASATLLASNPTGNINDGAGGTWTIVSGVVNRNGSPAGFTSGAVEIALVGSTMWVVNGTPTWYSWNGTNWIQGNNPITGGNWNNSTTANPATGTGGVSFSGLTCPCFATFDTKDTGSKGTINTTGPLAVTLPSGFLVWQQNVPITHHPFIINLGQNEHANDNVWYVPVRFEGRSR